MEVGEAGGLADGMGWRESEEWTGELRVLMKIVSRASPSGWQRGHSDAAPCPSGFPGWLLLLQPRAAPQVECWVPQVPSYPLASGGCT